MRGRDVRHEEPSDVTGRHAGPRPVRGGQAGPHGGPDLLARARGPVAERLLLELQRSTGNASVQRLVGDTAQRTCGCGGTCGTCKTGPAADTAEDTADETAGHPAAEPVVARQYAPPASGSRTPLQTVIDAVDAGGPTTLDDAFRVLNGRAMPELLRLLAELLRRGRFAVIKADAAARGGPRMDVACKVVEMRAAGRPSHDQLRDVVDMVETFPPDQRTAIFRFLGANLVINVRGVDIDVSYCKGNTGAGCEPEIREAIAWAQKMAGEYAACRGRPGVGTGDDVENCVDASLTRQGITTSTAGSTSSGGAVTITATPMTKCQPIMVRGTEIHEAVHAAHTRALQRRFGTGTARFHAARDSANNWISDEINAYRAEIPFYREVLRAMKKVCKTVASP